MISTRRRLEYAEGFIELGMMAEAARELDLVAPADRASTAVMLVRLDFLMAAKEWAMLAELAEKLAALKPEEPKGWLFHAYALRELQRVDEARAILLSAEPRHGATNAVLHYNLACYACLLGDKPEARRRLAQACALDTDWRTEALEDTDLQPMWEEIRASKP